MSDFLTHECGIAAVRLRKPLSYYHDRYGSALWGFHKLMLLMEKQHNRGQDGAGIGCVKLDMPNGKGYMERRRSIKRNALNALYSKEERDLAKLVNDGRVKLDEPETLKEHQTVRTSSRLLYTLTSAPTIALLKRIQSLISQPREFFSTAERITIP